MFLSQLAPGTPGFDALILVEDLYRPAYWQYGADRRDQSVLWRRQDKMTCFMYSAVGIQQSLASGGSEVALEFQLERASSINRLRV